LEHVFVDVVAVILTSNSENREILADDDGEGVASSPEEQPRTRCGYADRGLLSAQSVRAGKRRQSRQLLELAEHVGSLW